MPKIIKWISFGLLLLAPAAQAQVNAASCSNTDVQNAINSASAGQTVNIPAGSCSWSNVSLAKAITLNGAGQGVTNIDLGAGGSAFKISKQTGGVTRIQHLTFTVSNNMQTPHAVTVGGPWPNGQPVIFQNLTITLNNADFVTVMTPGGVIFSHMIFNGTWGSTLFTGKDVTDNASWSSPDTMGTRDTTGFANVYIEDNTFNGGTITDCDDGCRAVVRHNVGNDSGGFNSHGEDSSPIGMRHFEIYGNSFLLPDTSCPGGSNTSPSNINQFVWIRGGTGVIYNNKFDHLSTSCWGTKPEIKLSNRGAEDDRPQGTCSATHYPVPHQLGQNNNGSSDFTDPIWFWGNSGSVVAVSGSWAWNNPCSFNWNTFFQWGRDGMNTNVANIVLGITGGTVTGLGGSAKPGYSAYTYPHPLIGGSSSNAPAAPTNLGATVQ
jgi:hypothetical protein